MIRRLPVVALLVGAALLVAAGCSVGPNYVRPSIETPGAYKEVAEGAEWKPAQPSDGMVRGPWWEVFGDPLLNSLETQVSISNQNLLVAEGQFRQARALVLAARSQFFPTATVGAGYTRSRPSENLAGSFGPKQGASNDFILPVDVSWDIDVWGRVRRNVEANRANAQASAGDLEATRLLFQSELAQDYFLLRTVDAQRGLLNAAIAAYQTSLRLTRNRYAAGVVSAADVAQAETQLKTTQAQATDLGVQRAQLEHAIAVLIGRPPATLELALASLPAAPSSIPVGVPSELLERRPDVAAAERRVAAANAQIGVAVAAYYPTVTLSASAGFQSGSIAKWLVWPSRFFSVGPAVTETVFDGGLRGAQTAQARAAYDASVAGYRQSVLAAFQDVEDNLAALRILEAEAREQDEAVQAAERSLALTTNQYRAGVVSYLNVVIAQTAALTSEQTAVGISGRRLAASGCGEPDLLHTGQQLVLELGPPVRHTAASLSCDRSDVVRIDTDQRREPHGPRRCRTPARDRDAVGDQEEPARPRLVPVGARTAHRSLEVADHETDPHAPHGAVVRGNHLDERKPEPDDRLADLGRRGAALGGRNQDVLGDPPVRLQDQRAAEQRLEAEPGRRHRVVPGLKSVELGGRRERRQRPARLRRGAAARLRVTGEVSLVGRVALGDGRELASALGVGLVAARPIAHDRGDRLEGLPLQHREAAAKSRRPKLAGSRAGGAADRSAQARELLGQRHQGLAEQQREAAVGRLVDGHEVRALPAHGGIAVEPHGSLSTIRIGLLLARR